MRRAALLASVVILLAGCRYKLPGPPFVLEMPEVGAKVDLSGWILDAGAASLEPGTGKNARRFKGTTSGFLGEELSMRANPTAFPGLAVHRTRATDAKSCIGGMAERSPVSPVEALDVIAPLTVTTIAGSEAATLTVDVTLPGFEGSPIRSRYLALAKDGVCYYLEAQSQKPLWDHQSYLWEPAFASVKPL